MKELTSCSVSCDALNLLDVFYRAVTRSYYRGAVGALLVFDITNRTSFNALQNWLKDARSLASPHIVVLLVGNKKDLDGERDVTFLEASQFAQENGKETSNYCKNVIFLFANDANV